MVNKVRDEMVNKVRNEMAEKQVRVAQAIKGIAAILDALADDVSISPPEDVEATGKRVMGHLAELLETYADEMAELKARLAFLESI